MDFQLLRNRLFEGGNHTSSNCESCRNQLLRFGHNANKLCWTFAYSAHCMKGGTEVPRLDVTPQVLQEYARSLSKSQELFDRWLVVRFHIDS